MNTSQFFDFVRAEFAVACEAYNRSQQFDAAESMAAG
jgi:hypothetical protein